MPRTTFVTTFYSFKGGVGRTMLLVNVGAALAGTGRRVLMWDLDVEAPGMHRIPALTPKPMPREGFLEWLLDWQTSHRMREPGKEALKSFDKLIKRVDGVDGLHILPAFGDKADPAGLYQKIQWHEFMVRRPARGLELFQTLLEHLRGQDRFDHILLDARTGITDLGGLMTAVLPDATVLVGSYGAQNLAGLLGVYEALQPAVDGRIPARKERKNLVRLVVVSPVPESMEDRRVVRKGEWDRAFPFGKEETRIEIPFDNRLLFMEDLLVLSDPGCRAARQYQKVAGQVEKLRQEMIETTKTDTAMAAVWDPAEAKKLGEKALVKGQRFEDHVARLLTLLDYRVEPEQIIDGNRVDLVARKQSGLRAECYLVECKDTQKPVAKEVLEKLRVWLDGTQPRGMRAEGMVVARRFSPAAMSFARSQGILVYTPEDLENILFDFGTYLARLRRRFEESELARTYVDQRVLLEATQDKCTPTDLLPHALAWSRGEGRRLWLLLGDYGTGKTSFFRRFSYELAKQAEALGEDGSRYPVPIAIDLKDFPNAINLESLLQEHFRTHADWHGNPEILLYLLEAGKAILLLDAFDEMGTATAGRSVEEQFRQLARPATLAAKSGGNRVMITCRTHFFRDQQYVKDVASGCPADDLISRDSPLGKVARAFDATIDELMLFDETQIDKFLHNHLSEEKAKEAAEFIRNTYDLPSLAPRPVLLEMIVNSLPELMKEGKGITPAGLYHRYTSQWLENRSGGSLQTTPDQRKRLLEHLAFELWGRPQNRIHHRELVGILRQIPAREVASLDLDRVDLELRTAAFLTRTADGFYGFSHKSFREFFYACFLLRSLREGTLAHALNTITVTSECIRFLSELVEEPKDRISLEKGLRTILKTAYGRIVSENALRTAYLYALHLSIRERQQPTGIEKGLSENMKTFIPKRAKLQGAMLNGEQFQAAWLSGIDLTGAGLEGVNLKEAYLSEACFKNARLAGSSLDGAKAERADFARADLMLCSARSARFTGASFQETDLSAAVMTGSDCIRADFRNANCCATRFAEANLKEALWDGARTVAMTGPCAEGFPLDQPQVDRLVPYLHLRHAGAVKSAVFSADGNRVLTASFDKTARIWDAVTGKEIRRFEGHGGGVNSAEFSADGNHVLTASSDDTVRIWNAATGKEIRHFEGHGGGVKSAVFSADGNRVLTASHDTVRILDAATGKEIRRFEGHGGEVRSAVFSADGNRMLTASSDDTVRIRDAATGMEILRLEEHGGRVNSAVFSTDGNRVLTASHDTVRIWDAATGMEILRFEGQGRGMNSAVFSTDGNRVLTASHDTVRIWDVATGKEIRRFEGHGGGVNSAVFSTDGSRVLTASSDDTVRIWDAAMGMEILRFEEHGGGVNSAVFSTDGNHVLTASSDDTVRIWDAATGMETRHFKGYGRGVRSAVFSEDGNRVLTASDDTVRIWDAETGMEIRCLEGHVGVVRSAVFSADGNRVLTASDDNTARIWDAATGMEMEILRFEEHGGGVNSAVFSTDGNRVLTASGDTVRIWDASTGMEIRRFEGHVGVVRSAVFSADGNRVLIVSSGYFVRIWDAVTGMKTQSFEVYVKGVRSAVFSEDGDRVLTASHDTVRIWDASTGMEIRRFEGHVGVVRSAFFSADGNRVLAASDDNTARIWDATTGKEIRIFVPVRGGWLTLDDRGYFDGEGLGLEALSYVDPDEVSLFPTHWAAEDLAHVKHADAAGKRSRSIR